MKALELNPIRQSSAACISTLVLQLLASTAAAAVDSKPAPPSNEMIDAHLMTQIRNEGLQNSRAASFVSDLADGVGARLMGSPNMRKAYAWSLATLTKLGASNAHLEDIGEFGLSWRQNNAWMRLSSPDSMVFIAQASPWSVSSHGIQEAEAVAVEIASEADFEKYRGKLKGKIVLLGPMRDVPQPTVPFSHRWSGEDLRNGKASEAQRRYWATVDQHRSDQAKRTALNTNIGKFLTEEHVSAVVMPSRNAPDGGGTGDLEIDNPNLTSKGWTVDTRVAFPVILAAVEDFGRVWRLSTRGTAVRIQFDVDTEELGEHEHGYNVVAQITGSDPRLRREIVLVGAHLDSWASGTGAADNGAGVAACLEVVRILWAVHARPRRTIRIVLYTGEEEGLFGSKGYVSTHLARQAQDTAVKNGVVTGQDGLQILPDYPRFSAAYNIDHGSGRIRGVFTGQNAQLAAIFRQWIAPLRDLGVEQVIDERNYPADQSSYTSVGLPGISFVQDPLDYDSRAHHSNLDTVERISPGDLAQAATVLAVFVMDTADRDALLPRALPPK
jgi:carboxypeptidase Q